MTRYLKFKMYSSLIFGKLAILTGLYLFITNSDKMAAGRFFELTMGLCSVAIGLYLILIMKKGQPNKI